MSWILSYQGVGENHIRVIIPIIILWFIWRASNGAKFDSLMMRAESIVWQVGNFIEQLGEANKLGSFRGDKDCIWAKWQGPIWVGRRLLLVAWVRPAAQFFKLNTDSSVISSRAFGSGLVCSSEGKVIFSFYKEFGEASVLLAEALALLFGLNLCFERGFDRVCCGN